IDAEPVIEAAPAMETEPVIAAEPVIEAEHRLEGAALPDATPVEQLADAAPDASEVNGPVRLPPGYELDYDLSDPEGYVETDEPAPAAAPVAPATFEPGPDTELGSLSPDEAHYELDLEPAPVESFELSVSDEVEFSSADAHSQLPPPAVEPAPAPEAEAEAEPELPAEPEPAIEEVAPVEVVADLESGPLPLLRESAAPDPVIEDAEPVSIAAVATQPPVPDPEADEPEFVRLAREKELASRRRTIMLALGTVVLALALLAQGITTFRNVLVAKYPALKPAMTAGCAVLRCKIELPAQLDALKIEAPELQSLGQNTFVLTTLLRNESGLAQAWPYIHLELTDANDKPLVRRVFTPAQYLPATVPPAKGFGATSEQAVKIHFELKQLKASGFHVAVFYP
ncbi:MAG TPA: DUF3426 domain-containing protein, partial [Telluria sp.]